MIARAVAQRGVYFVLDKDREPFAVDFDTWVTWYQSYDTVIKQTGVNGFEVSTIFIGINASVHAGPPVLWETAVFNECEVTACYRYSSERRALEGHEELVRDLR